MYQGNYSTNLFLNSLMTNNLIFDHKYFRIKCSEFYENNTEKEHKRGEL